MGLTQSKPHAFTRMKIHHFSKSNEENPQGYGYVYKSADNVQVENLTTEPKATEPRRQSP
jgi:hypothetical protein